MNTEHTREAGVDVAVIGGGAAGLSAAVALARSLRSVVVVDAGEQRNAPAAGVHNVLALDGTSPLDLLTAGREEAERYGARIHRDRAVTARRHGEGFEVGLAGGGVVRSRRLLLATGLVDELPDIPGVRELWGSGVLHCAYCHGWEVRGQRIGVVGTTSLSAHQALMFRQLSGHVTLFTHTMPELDDQTRERLTARDIGIVDGTVERLRTDNGTLRGVVLTGGYEFGADAATVTPRFLAREDLYEQLGGTLTEHPLGAFVGTSHMGKTDVPGVWAAGNSADLGAMVAASSGSGAAAATAINADLVTENADAAVHARGQTAGHR
ncbi:thioredoxin reductase [Haloactinospora alba]|uniref:Thioredoxin reductase n=1 Tax=Haloactinospora alba TaxID=405555 RepID=A0A543N7L2_9ACTN|nr:NAD(P)/FAD-dependent oxidoreductase [Haloactinospora alba]TQN27798.1 thioredoxin reductase [Haloactinospora alba]